MLTATATGTALPRSPPCQSVGLDGRGACLAAGLRDRIHGLRCVTLTPVLPDDRDPNRRGKEKPADLGPGETVNKGDNHRDHKSLAKGDSCHFAGFGWAA